MIEIGPIQDLRVVLAEAEKEVNTNPEAESVKVFGSADTIEKVRAVLDSYDAKSGEQSA